MNNKQVCKNIKEWAKGRKFIADSLVSEGYGQNYGGYIDDGKATTQLEHFLSYYENRPKKITYAYLRCPQLILFVAQVMGAPEENVEEAAEVIRKFDDRYIGKKNGNYMWGTQELRDVKNILHYGQICSIVKNAEDYKKMQDEVQKLYKE